MPTEELFGNYHFAMDRAYDDETDRFDIILDDNAANEIYFDGSDVGLSGIIAVELDAGRKVQAEGFIAENGSRTAEGFTATDDLWL